MHAAGASWITSICSGSMPRRSSASCGELSGGHDHARGALHRELAQAHARTPVRSSSLRRFSADRSCSVTTIGHGLCSSAPFIHGA